MSRLLRWLGLLACLGALGLVILSFLSHRGSAPGLERGMLHPCPDRPNCVCSQFGEDGDGAWTAPLAYEGSADAAFARLLETLEAMDGATLVTSEDDYAAFEFRTPLLSFVDDVELLLAPADEVIHVRSASRVGYSDLGVNAKRVERIRELFAGP